MLLILEKTLESPLDCKEIQPDHSKEDQPWVFFGRTDAKAETPVLWPPHAKSWLIRKDSDTGRDWGQEGKGMTEDEMAGWHHWLDGREFEWTLGDSDGQGGLACCDSWGRKESDTTERLNWTELRWYYSEKVVAPHSSTLAWKIPWMEEPGGLQSMGLSRVFSNTTVQKHQFFSTQHSSQSNSHIHTWLLEKP